MRHAPPLGLLIAAVASSALTACSTDAPCAEADLSPLGTRPTWAVTTSDFISTAVALLDARGELMTEAWIDSGTTRPGLSAAVSGDVALAHTSAGSDALVLVDRGLDLVTRIDLASGGVLDQALVRLAESGTDTAFAANPQDAVRLESGDLLVSRFEINADPTAPELDRGNDLVVLSETTGELLRRIALDHLAVSATVDGAPVTNPARPEQMAYAEDRVVVGLARLSEDFRTAGDGAVAIIDEVGGAPGEASATAIPLPGLANCGDVGTVPNEAAPNEPTRVVVACAGPTFTDEEGRRASAGLALIDVPAAPAEPTVAVLWRAGDHPGAPVVSVYPIALGGNLVVGVATGDLDGQGDRLVLVNMETGETEVLLQATDPFVLGAGALDEETHTLLIPDASVGLRRLELSRDTVRTVMESSVTDVSPCRRLGPREIRRL